MKQEEKIDIAMEEIGPPFYKCRCCEGKGWIYHPYHDGGISYTKPNIVLPKPQPGEKKPPSRRSTWQRIRNFLGR